jgi:type III secretion protein C
VPVIVAEGIQVEIVKQYPKMSPEAYLNAITSDNNLFWFEKSGIIFVYPSSKLESRILPIGNVEPSGLIDALRGFRLYSETYPPRFERRLGLVYFTGPEDYLNEVEKIVRSVLRATGGDPSVEVGVEVFYLEYAWADDRTYTLGETQVAIPGVATVLRNVLTGQTGPLGFQGRVSYQLPNNRAGLRGAGLIGPYNQLLVNTQQAAIDSQVAAAQAEASFQATATAQQQIDRALEAIEGADPDALARQQVASAIAPVIQAEPRLNAIIIRDVRERLKWYRDVIEKLDQPVSLVEITASIIDVDATYGLEFGLPMNLRFNRDGVQRSIIGNIGTDSLINLASPGNLTFQLADGAVNMFLANLRALESEGHARMLANPSVVTLDNQDAFLEESEEFFIRVAGNEQVDLFNVVVGTKLTITPHVIYDPVTRRIRLNVNVQDGSRSATEQVDAIPVVSRNTINTQAVLLEGQSLLIGA